MLQLVELSISHQLRQWGLDGDRLQIRADLPNLAVFLGDLGDAYKNLTSSHHAPAVPCQQSLFLAI